ncbi:membrane biogenesis protein [Photobacterium iliopiscarium]|uniref:Outer membrane protein assembly factor BamB n=1 Tax=Photobacterium iliopiscarium TaxID=56192 RepID=A0ABX5GRB8_9GAMM|nr:outer membrane protein assembly factor BamB [Photobacterium iliopiscarium]KJG22138.1 membrane biogenesis protein [Photobacterium iliopiscarium]PSW95097.1 outer membrane protein assembly factor BamB [Photobacterium iliopiscarium]
MHKVLKRALAVAIAVSVLSGCASEVDSIHMAPLPKVDNTFTPKTDWSRSVGDGVSGYYSKLTPVVGQNKVFVADRNGLVEALDPSNGKVLWKNDLEKETSVKISGGLVLAEGKIFIGTENADVIALDAETGKEVWRAKVAGEVLSKPLVNSGIVVVNTSSGMLEALNADTGKSKWQISNEIPTLTLRGTSSPVAISGGVFWGLSNGRLEGAILNDGRVLWQQTISTPKGSTEIDRLVDVDAAPVISGDRLYAIGYNGSLVSIDLRSGQIAWKRNYSSATNFVVDGNELFLVTAKDHIVAVDARSGTELWQNKDLQYRQLSAPAVIDGYLVMGDAEGYLHWLDAQSGEFVSQESIDGSGIAVPPVALDDNGFIVVTRDGEINKMQISK